MDVISVDTDALVSAKAGSASVYVVRDDKAALVPVALGIASDERTEIMSGLAMDDQVVIVGHNRLNDGDPVKIVTM